MKQRLAMPLAITAESGFSYMELLIVLAIMLVLGGTVSINGGKLLAQARVMAAKTQIQAIDMALLAYYSDCGRYPSEVQGLAALTTRPTIHPVPEAWNGPYLDAELSGDPWGAPFQYSLNASLDGNSNPLVYSLGADNAPGGSGINEDVY